MKRRNVARRLCLRLGGGNWLAGLEAFFSGVLHRWHEDPGWRLAAMKTTGLAFRVRITPQAEWLAKERDSARQTIFRPRKHKFPS